MTLPVDPSKPSDIRIPANIRGDLKKIHLLGRPGRGRGSMLEHMILEDLRQERPIVVLDPRGELIEVTDPDVEPAARTDPKGEPCPGS